MRHFARLNRVAYAILRRRHPMVLTLLEQNDRVKLRSHRVSGGIPAAVRRRSSIARPSHRMCAVSQRLCVRRRLPSQIICVANGHLLRVRPFIIARRYSYHAVSSGHRWTTAICGIKPKQRGNGWSEDVGDAVTCPRCLARLGRDRGG
jgi:hypothetical protein